MIDELVQLTDIRPTVFRMLGLPDDDDDSVGMDLLQLADGDDVEWRERVFIEEAHTQRRIGIRTNEYKYLEHVPDSVLEEEWGDSLTCWSCNTVHGGEEELYDLRSDPEETDNIIRAKPEIADDMRETVDSWWSDIAHPDVGGEDVSYEDEEAVIDRLQDLGYFER